MATKKGKGMKSEIQIISLPRALRKRVVASARRNERSISGEVRFALSKHLREQERSGKGAPDG
jgi:hypothetical protein